jgi:hypothetical protein
MRPRLIHYQIKDLHGEAVISIKDPDLIKGSKASRLL